jgi:hypothetical protein
MELLGDNPALLTQFMLVSGAGVGASSFMAPPLTGPELRCAPQIYCVGLRRGLLLEPWPGTAALAREYNLKCPDCDAQLGGCDADIISEHLVSCGGAGGWYHQAGAVNRCVQSMFTDVGIVAKLEPPGTSPGSLHRAADVGSARMPVPASFDAGGTHCLACDSGVCYFSAPRAGLMATKPGWGAAQVERDKPSVMAREVAQKKERKADPTGYDTGRRPCQI